MNEAELVRLSKFLSFILRHQPEAAGLELAVGGWVGVDSLLAALEATGWQITRADLEQLVFQVDKRRFSFDEAGQRFRANYGHSVAIDLELAATEPPDSLFHGTAARFIPLIKKSGLSAQNRQFVHLSSDPATAKQVGRRHGEPVILVVRSGELYRQGHSFFQASQATWLTDNVPAKSIRFP